MNELKNCVQYIGHGLKFIGHEIKENTELAEHERGIHVVMSAFGKIKKSGMKVGILQLSLYL
jgi:hypothetical protein